MLILALLQLAGAPVPDVPLQPQSELRSWLHMPSVGDVDGDGVPDLIHERERVLSLVSGADPSVKLSSFLVASFYPEEAGPTWEVGPDVDGDGIRDVAVLNGFALVSTVFIDVFSGRTGLSLGRTEKELPGHVMSVAWTDDVDGDGLADIAVIDRLVEVYSSKSLERIWRSRVQGPGFKGTSPMGNGVSARSQVCRVEDFDGDGVRDLAIGVRFHEKGANALQLGAKYAFSYAVLSGANGVRIQNAPRVPMASLPISTFGWLSGDWIQTSKRSGEQLTVEESWNTPAAGMMLGISRTSVQGAEEGQFEFLRLSCEGRKVMLHPSPNGQQADPFRLKSYGDKEAVFENLAHDFPQVIRYWREGDKLRASIGTKESPAEYTFAFSSRSK